MAEIANNLNQVAESNTVTVVEEENASAQQDLPTLRLRLKKPKSKKQVKWGEDTVDNEHLNKKKSKCCCIYNKPRAFGESSDSEDDDECDNCHGHVERRKKARGEGGGDQDTAPTSTPPPLVPA
ncbi:E3 ubiquitin-protein ligase PPP1R11 [Macrosteles quadrilineatus]|uniref:E3 ubiquitin-protein ligase PPP1R11 n=1 Tax=Macrosteles quadrilineatus TaxID=74068 RepID=UPI0023E0C018|nr:E3 ubiquitin-protein ligase PPP1R11 [Macrosteles quadrilineatus]